MTCVFAVSALGTLLEGAGGPSWTTLAASAAQYYSFALMLGLLADLETLKMYGRTRADLADVHNLGSAAAVASTIVVAAATAAMTAVLAGSLQPFFNQLVPPIQPATPPAASSTR